jgi:hypothetical protein
MVVYRKWLPLENKSSNNTGVYIDIWDSGDKKIERWPDGTEFHWQIVNLESLENGAIKETLEPLEQWDTPKGLVWSERIPLLNGIFTKYEIPGWRIVQEMPPTATGASKSERRHRSK